MFGLWTNGTDLAFRMRTYQSRIAGNPLYTELDRLPGPAQSRLRRTWNRRHAQPHPRRAKGDSLLRACSSGVTITFMATSRCAATARSGSSSI